MRGVIALLLCALAAPATGQKPWEARVDLPVSVPLELPALPAANPFARSLISAPELAATPLEEKLDITLTVSAAAYVDRGGACRRVVTLDVPLPGLAAEVQEALLRTDFTAGSAFGAPQATWVPVEIDLSGRVKEGRVLGLRAAPPDPASPPRPDVVVSPVPQANDLALPAVPVEELDVLPSPRRFRMSVRGQTVRGELAILVEVDDAGKCRRVVFLSCADGLRGWVLRSLARWSLSPARDYQGPVTAWLEVAGQLEVELSSLSAGGLRILRESSFPGAAPAPASDPPRGG